MSTSEHTQAQAHSPESIDLRATVTELIGPQLARLQSNALIFLLVGAALCGLGAVMDLSAFFQAYLFAYLFWFGVTAGSLAFLMLHHTVGGGWSFMIRRFLEAGSRLMPYMALLFLPVVATLWLKLPVLYGAEMPGGEHGWAHPDAAHDPVIRAKMGYLNPTRFTLFSVIYFAVWWLFAHYLNRLGATQDERRDMAVHNRLNLLGGAGIVVYVLTMTLASVDWALSLEPKWTSSIWGLLTVASQALSTLALMILLLGVLAGQTPLLRGLRTGYFRDLGNFTLALVMLWAYLSFSQYLITYSGNTAEEVLWYVRRAVPSWQIIGGALIALHFAVPFLVLLTWSAGKRDPQRLKWIAAFLIFMRFVDLFWWVAPNFRPQLSLNPADLGAPLLLGGIWLFLWIRELRTRSQPVLPLHDPRLQGGLHEVLTHG